MRTLFAPVLAILLLQSCAAYKYIDIQYYDNPEKFLPDCSEGVVILSNLGVKNTGDKRSLYEWSLDSVASAEAVASMQNSMLKSPLFSNYDIQLDSYGRADTSNVILPLRWNVLEQISSRNGNAKIIVSLDYMHITPKMDSYTVLCDGFMKYYGYLQLDVYYYWRVYNLNTHKTSNTFLNRDTLTWENTDWVEVKPGNQLPGVFAAAAYSGTDAARQYAAPYLSVWENASRLIYYKGNELMEKAYGMALSGEWTNAAGIWQTLQSSTNKDLAAKAAFNLALANEMLDRFDVAYEWLRKSYELSPALEGIHEYQHIIEDRMAANR